MTAQIKETEDLIKAMQYASGIAFPSAENNGAFGAFGMLKIRALGYCLSAVRKTVFLKL